MLYFLAEYSLPDSFVFPGVEGGRVDKFYAFVCTAMGLWSGLIIGYTTEYYTSNAYRPV